MRKYKKDRRHVLSFPASRGDDNPQKNNEREKLAHEARTRQTLDAFASPLTRYLL